LTVALSIVFAAAALVTSRSDAQIVLRSSDGPRVGDSIIAWFIVDSLLSQASSAVEAPVPGQTWNFNLSGWSKGFGYLRATVVPAQGTMFDTAYPGASLAVVETEENQQNGFLAVVFSYLRALPDRYEDMGTASYYRASSDAPRAYLLISKKSGYGLPLPMAFGNERIEVSTSLNLATPYDTSYPPAPRRSTVGTTTLSTTVDGWGTAITPFGSFQALRVHTVETAFDSLFNEAGEHTDEAVDTIETYNWYTEELGAAVPAVSIEVYEGEIVSAFLARRIGEPKPPLGVDQPSELSRLETFPNPAHDAVTIVYPPRARELTLCLYAYDGRLVDRRRIPSGEAIVGRTRLDIASLPVGSYLARIEGVGSVVIRRDFFGGN